MKIAAFLNEKDEVVNFLVEGSIKLFDNTSGVWLVQKEVPFCITTEMGLSKLRELLKDLSDQLEECQIFLVYELRGILGVFLEELGFRLWQSEGPLQTQLENVSLKDQELIKEQEESCKTPSACSEIFSCSGGGCASRHSKSAEEVMAGPVPTPVLVGEKIDGFYRMDLAAALKSNPALNSKDILIPFLEQRAFQKLELTCDHLPRWFNQEADLLKLEIKPEQLGPLDKGIKVIIFSKKGKKHGV